jgi:hypothetical protein
LRGEHAPVIFFPMSGAEKRILHPSDAGSSGNNAAKASSLNLEGSYFAPGLVEKSDEMKSLAWYPWFPDRWMGSSKARRMTWTERGLYRELLDWQWQERGVLPADISELSQLVGEDMTKHPRVLEMFPVVGDKRANPVLARIWSEQAEKHERRRMSGKRRWKKEELEPELELEAYAHALHEQCSSNAPALLKDTPEALDGKIAPESDFRQRLRALYGRRATTPWTPKERKVLATIEANPDALEDLSLIEKHYAAMKAGPKDKDYRRRDMQTLLNNWSGAVDRARNWQPPKKPVLL